ncbi:S8 family peptidase [Anaeromicropila herbilytica]|uniref:Peptidase S8/S53 domain-containing protein n=1 Tax=Anaeromicropila herbilytica TaxID=2785025 RepID=A0A7R7EL08_9FIRM|nr:S8 family peptidase [Anaeromicropila herbilytica]BCN30729.1 hypothetical protein bsdtb5_20240 [Anaeromicropila herbilytica]
MTQEEQYKITSNQYFDLIISYNGNIASLDKYKEYSIHILNDYYAVIYIPISQVSSQLFIDFGYSAVPKCYSLASMESLEVSGVNKIRNLPSVNLRGNGVLIGLIDTGIDYTNTVFQNADSTSRIAAIWDQTIESKEPYAGSQNPPFYGVEYRKDQINQALKSSNPYDIVPSKDENGHGTMLAGIAAGSESQENNFSGVAPDSELVIVKLKEAKENLRNYYAIPTTVPCYQENDLIWGVQYILYMARELRRPVAICIGLGTSQGPHDNSGPLNNIVSLIADIPGVSLSVAVGNEGNTKRHYYSSIKSSSTSIPFELNVGENEIGFSMEFWGDPPMVYTLDIISPSGEYIQSITENLEVSREISFIFEKTIINIEYFMIEPETGKQVIFLRFRNPAKGIWRFLVYGRGDLDGAFHVWLPSGDLISPNITFINPNPYTTVTSPGNSITPLTITAYNSSTNALYPNASKGFSTSNIINPDLAAPGVNLRCPTLNHQFTSISGTGAATAHTVGITALILEWCIVRGNYPGIDTVSIKKFLFRGAKRSDKTKYPNEEWGYGIIDLYNSFNIIRTFV